MRSKTFLALIFILFSTKINAQVISTLVSGITYPTFMALDSSGYLYVSSLGDHLVRKINISTGATSIVAGTATPGYNGDGIPATSAQLNGPCGIAVDKFQNIYIAEMFNVRVRKIDKITGLISTIAGTGVSGYNGDGIPATSAQFVRPNFVVLDSAENIYVSGINDSRIRKIDKTTGLISTIVGTGINGYNGDGIPATSAQVWAPEEMAFDELGNFIFWDDLNNRFRKISTSSGIITTIAGSGVAGFSGDGGLATLANFHDAEGLQIDALGNMYVSDLYNNRIRKIDKSTGIVNTIAGGGTSGLGDGGLASNAQLDMPEGIAIDQFCNMYIADFNNNRIRKITGLSNCINSIEENGRNISTAISPNPFSTNATLEIKNVKLKNAQLNISDLFGRTVKVISNIQNNVIQLERENLANGIYFYQLFDCNLALTSGKFILF